VPRRPGPLAIHIRRYRAAPADHGSAAPGAAARGGDPGTVAHQRHVGAPNAADNATGHHRPAMKRAGITPSEQSHAARQGHPAAPGRGGGGRQQAVAAGWGCCLTAGPMTPGPSKGFVQQLHFSPDSISSEGAP